MSTGKLVLLRHGQSIWNLENLFTGWIDVDLSAQGLVEAREAGQLLRAEGIAFDLAFTSVLKRAIRTLWIALDEMDMMWLPVERSWRLNERHYGALQGLDKAQTVAKHGAEQVKVWRRSYDIPPPPLEASHPQHPRFDRRYARSTGGRAAVIGIAEGHAGARAALLERAHRARARRRAQRAGGRARQQPARPGEDARPDERRGHRRAQHPDRRAAAVRTRFEAASRSRAATSATPRRSRRAPRPSRGRPKRRSNFSAGPCWPGTRPAPSRRRAARSPP